MESYKGYKKTNMVTYPYGVGARQVYVCIEEGEYKGKLFYRWKGFWAGIFKEDCYETDRKL